MDKLDAWDPSKADDPTYMMNMAKKYVVLDTLTANGGKCTYAVLFERSEELHCDVLAAAVKSLKKSKAVAYEGQMLLMPMNKDVEIELVDKDFDPFA
mmetsp:Transcript_22035/g.45011  ORF Transcript_22035/g.45011 Transcript_22035/m.45011 type:complete len:97 (-) Transcript_22035:143-433(-)